MLFSLDHIVLILLSDQFWNRNLNNNPVSCGITTAELFLNFTWTEWLNIQRDIKIPQACIHTPTRDPVTFQHYWNNLDAISIMYFTYCNGKIHHNLDSFVYYYFPFWQLFNFKYFEIIKYILKVNIFKSTFIIKTMIIHSYFMYNSNIYDTCWL